MKLTKTLSLALLLGALWSCQEEDLQLEEATQEVISESTEIKKLMGSEVPVLKQKDGTYLLGGKGGDIILFEENLTAPILQK